MGVQLFILGFILLAPMQLPAQAGDEQEYLIRHYDIEDGLPVNSVNDMAQDDDGYLYIATYDGLVRYDGYEFKTYNSGNTAGMETNRIGGFLKALDNTIWLFNEDGSVTSKSGEIFKTYHSPAIPGHASWLVEGTDGRIWVTGSQGIAFFDEESREFTRLDDPVFDTNFSLAGTGINGEVYAVNNYGLVSWKRDSASLLLDINDYPRLIADVRQLRQFEKDIVWLIGARFLMKVNVATNEVNRVNLDDLDEIVFWNIHQKEDGNYILTGNAGFYALDAQTLTLEKLSIPINSNPSRTNIVFEGKEGEDIFIGDDEVVINAEMILQVPSIRFGFLDKEGAIWIGSETDGLYQIQKSSFINLTHPGVPGLSNVYSIIQDQDGAIWTCSQNEGITRLSASGRQNWNNSNSSFNVDYCKFLYEDTDGTIYAGFLNNDIRIFKNGSWIPLEPANVALEEVLSIPEAMHRTGDQLLIGHLRSLLAYEEGNLRFFDESQPQSLAGVQVITENSKGVLFVGTSGNGLTRIENNTFINYSANDEILYSDVIRDIYLQSDDTLWIATENIGLNRLILDETGAVLSSVSITTRDGLTHNSLHRIIEDYFGNLWFSSNGGLMRIPKKSLNQFADGELSRFPVLHFDEKDGMINREANGGVQSAGILTNDQKLWFPNQRGVTIIDPYDFQDNQNGNETKPVIESIEFENEFMPVYRDSIHTIPKHQRNVRVNFTAPNFAYQDRMHFSYKLDGVNPDWQSADQSRQAVFTALPAGLHTLRVRAEFIGREPAEAVMMFSIPYKFYETRWFWGLMVITIAAFIWGGFKYRFRQLEARERKLQKRVDEQTEELQKAAEQKQRFFTGITHELKTPLSLIVGPLDDMADQPEGITPETVKNRLSLIHRNSHRLKHLVDQILDVSKLNADAIRLTLQPVDLAEFTRRVSGQFQSLLEQKELSLNIHTEPIAGQIYVDAEAWERIVINLLSNAIKFSPKGSEIEVKIEDRGDSVQVSIRDEGPGISAEHQQKIFEYLYQVEGSKAAEGTGIGLYLVKGLIEEMGGIINVHSEEGKGAEFTITLKKGAGHFNAVHTLDHEPLKTESPSYKELKSSQDPAKSKSNNVEKILVVEDNFDFRNYLKSILQEKYSVITASNGNEALQVLEKETPGLIISDVMMPKMGGLEFVNFLRKKDHFKHLPVIFLSAKNHEADVETGLSTGADIYLTKPIRSKMLLSQIEAVLRRERVLRSQEFLPQKKEEPELVRQIREIIYRQLANPSLTVNMLADALFISRAKLYAEWKELSEITLNEFIKQLRLNEAKVLLREKGFNVQETARAVGYTDANYFSTSFKKEFGVSPSGVR